MLNKILLGLGTVASLVVYLGVYTWVFPSVVLLGAGPAATVAIAAGIGFVAAMVFAMLIGLAINLIDKRYPMPA